MSAGIEVTGGPAGTTAVTEQIHGSGSALLAVAARVADVVPDLAALCAHPALALAAALDPLGAARVAGAAAGALGGEAGLVASAAGCARLGAGAHLAAEVYRVAETDAERLASAAWRTVAPAVVGPSARAAAVAAPVLAASAVTTVVLSATAWVVVRAAPVLAAAGQQAVRTGLRGDLRGGLEVWKQAGPQVRERLADDLAAVALAAQVAAARHPGAVREAVHAVPVAVGALVPQGVQSLLAGVPLADGRLDPVPDTVPEVAGLVATAGALVGTARQGEVAVHPIGPPRRSAPATDVAGLVDRLRPYAPPAGPAAAGAAPAGAGAGPYTPGRIRVDRLEGAGGRRWVVYLPPTQTWSFAGGALPADGTANLRMVGGLGSDALEAARSALARAGVAPGEPVLAVGYSQGGMTAAALAADPGPGVQVEAVVTFGSPISHVPLPPEVDVLSVENGADLTPDLDGANDPDRSWWTSVERAGPVDTRDPWSSHHLEAYAATARLVDAADDPSLVAWRERVAPFLDRGAEVTAQELTTRRTVP